MEQIYLLEIAIPCPLKQTFYYLGKQDSQPGSRVLAPFGARKLIGIALNSQICKQDLSDLPPFLKGVKLKYIIENLDETPVFSKTLIALAQWISAYYLYPIGEVFKTMLPLGSYQIAKETWYLSEKGELLKQEKTHLYSDFLRKLFSRKNSLLKDQAKKKISALLEKNPSFQDEAFAIEKMFAQGLITKDKKKSVVSRKLQLESANAAKQAAKDSILPTKHKLHPQQQEVITKIIESSQGQSTPLKPFLLWGITGSGKTEVYLEIIAHIFRHSAKQDEQVLVLVPEISLTPQMTLVFSMRFTNMISVVHSGLKDQQRWEELEKIRTGQHRILIGARSAVFAPFKNLKLIIVDEEHDGSYKQNSQLNYNARDIAVLRAQLEKAICLLGSATPSLESFWNAETERYTLLQMNQRPGAASLPEVSFVLADARQQGVIISKHRELSAADEHNPFSKKILDALKENHQKGLQSIVLVNRRGYSFYLYDLEKKEVVQCPECSISLTLHKVKMQLHCHYCDYKIAVARLTHTSQKYLAIGYGSQKAEEFLMKSLPQARVARLDSDIALNRNKLYGILDDFRRQKIDILVGTQILAKGHDFPNVSLTVLLDVDHMLNLPDFRAGERTFQFIVQAAGRSGRGTVKGKVLCQVLKADHPTILAGFNQDYSEFAKQELCFRRAHSYPPFNKQLLWRISSQNKKKLDLYCDTLEQFLNKFSQNKPEDFSEITINGPLAPAIEKISGRFRKMLLFSAKNAKKLHGFHFNMTKAAPPVPREIRVTIDVDPQSLL